MCILRTHCDPQKLLKWLQTWNILFQVVFGRCTTKNHSIQPYDWNLAILTVHFVIRANHTLCPNPPPTHVMMFQYNVGRFFFAFLILGLHLNGSMNNVGRYFFSFLNHEHHLDGSMNKINFKHFFRLNFVIFKDMNGFYMGKVWRKKLNNEHNMKNGCGAWFEVHLGPF